MKVHRWSKSSFLPTGIPSWIPLWFRVSTLRVMDIHTLHCHCSSKGRWPNWLQSAFLFATRLIQRWKTRELKSCGRRSQAHLDVVCFFTFCSQQDFYESSQLSRDIFLEDEFSVWKTLAAILESLTFLHTHASHERWWCLSYVNSSSQSSRHAEPYETQHTHTHWNDAFCEAED